MPIAIVALATRDARVAAPVSVGVVVAPPPRHAYIEVDRNAHRLTSARRGDFAARATVAGAHERYTAPMLMEGLRWLVNHRVILRGMHNVSVWSILIASSLGADGARAADVAPAPDMPGDPVGGLSDAERQRFEHGRVAFETSRDISTGLGPLFNDSACNRCHNRPALGGGGIQRVMLIGHLQEDAFDPLFAGGGPGLAANAVTSEIASARKLIPTCKLSPEGEPVPPDANVVVQRRTTALFGLGLVDATPDATFLAIAGRQPPEIRGRAALVMNLATGGGSVGKFGWKAKAPSLHQFSGSALLNELGVTNPEFPDEQAPLNNPALLEGCDVTPGLEDDGSAVAAMTDFVQLLAPIPPLEQSAEARKGDALFTKLGCDGCHVRRITSGESPVAALTHKEYAPFSDFLLHDMGSIGDFIGAEGDAAPREMRTAPLWGLRLAGPRYLHDSRARSVGEAIERHDGQGAPSRSAYVKLSTKEKAALIAFLQTL
jgi:CxxC motif-containing protein (DUF1111 family)